MITYYCSFRGSRNGVSEVEVPEDAIKAGYLRPTSGLYREDILVIGKSLFLTRKEACADVVRQLKEEVAFHMASIEKLQKKIELYSPSKGD